MADVFISHVEEDEQLALGFAKGLEEAGFTTWYYERDNLPGVPQLQQTTAAIGSCRAFLLLISPDSLSSHEVNIEVGVAHDNSRPFLPIRKGVTHKEFRERRPMWCAAAGGAVSLSVGSASPSALVPRLVSGLQALGIEPAGRREDETVHPPEAPKKTRPPRRPRAAPQTSASPPAPAELGRVWTSPADGKAMVYVPAREFLRGSPEGKGDTNECPQRLVHLDAFWIDKTEVTVAEYRRFCEATGRSLPEAPSWGWKDDHPVVKVTWEEATAYAVWAGKQLPTEAEWEKAARGTDGREYPWGKKWDAGKCVNKSNSGNGTQPVGSHPAGASPCGALDMAGNVWEWCADWFDENYYPSAPASNPHGPDSGRARVVRGGAWCDADPGDLRVAVRDGLGPTSGLGLLGFRCVLRPPGL